MQTFYLSVKRFLASDDGPTTVEYAVVLALVILVCVTAIQIIAANARMSLAGIRTRLGSS